jgi:uncharacterized protein YjiS (DUF1127 family)
MTTIKKTGAAHRRTFASNGREASKPDRPTGATMTTIDRRAEFVQTARLTPRISAFCNRCRSALQERRNRARLRATLHVLPDRILRDIGVSREDIEYLARNGTDERVDPREGWPRLEGWATGF